MNEEVTRELIKAFRKVTDEAGPEFVYQNPTPEEYRAMMEWDEDQHVSPNSCLYNRVGENSGCVVGETLREAGYAVPVSDEGKMAEVLLQEMFPNMDSVVRLAFGVAQSAQDLGLTWGEARIQFEDRLPLRFQL